MSNKQVGSIVPSSFNELDNWLGIMDVDPPKSFGEKRAMYERLMDILETMFETPEKDYPGKETIQKEMRKIIEP